ncbi:hypothetical protein BZ21_786 [Yersinia pseudotuberculosis]|uniref:Bacteriophage protein n=3 Tax=Yersinia pseudotuberculosis complex TaxID=1649845 RepID=A0ABM5Q1Q1_9GAMM|nr:MULTISPECIES: hypothetical protein [Yersinia pseudotuberculosis complex]AHK20749.1 hypothetical protein BF17_16735 [Yersinia similis]AJJ02108.1 hypothetical protein BZ21_786 [Yersinia pseudotuberculosis]AJJ60033.1 hypothetical protein BZ22_1812 [Yersinia pseudotuberculosis YPIII]AYW87277.1 hypothetical protein EGX87_08820 [Yersinia pseudotuberculosis]AYW92844.1 hypothetical protein EGX47_17085 [Yersinia pseudotuberculosis]
MDISGFGTIVNIRASKTFPAGFNVTQFADDADPLDSPSQQLADVGMGLNGDMVSWSVAQVLQVTLNITPNSDDDRNLAILAEANRIAKGKRSVNDEITMSISYPSGESRTLSGGVITDAMIGNSVSSAGRLKSKPYIFKFENQVIA